jgi:hypothetical protein
MQVMKSTAIYYFVKLSEISCTAEAHVEISSSYSPLIIVGWKKCMHLGWAGLGAYYVHIWSTGKTRILQYLFGNREQLCFGKPKPELIKLLLWLKAMDWPVKPVLFSQTIPLFLRDGIYGTARPPEDYIITWPNHTTFLERWNLRNRSST